PVAPTTPEQRLARKNEFKGSWFGGNKETKKVQKTLFKQQYENFTGSSSESLDQIHDRLQKLISQLEILKESLSQEDINLKFLRSLPAEWRTHTLIWRNMTDLEDQSLDDLFNSLKIYKAEVKSSSTTSHTTQNIAFVSSQNTDSTNESVIAVASVYAASTKVPISARPNVDTLILSFTLFLLMAMLTMRARRFLQKTGRNLGANGTTSIGFDMLKVECYNFHRKWHFAKECSYDWSCQAKEELTNYALMAFTSSSSFSFDNEYDGVGSYDWSCQAKEELTNYALMAFTSSSSFSSDNEAEHERDELKLKLDKFQTSSKNLSQLLASQTNDKTGLGYENSVFTSTVFDCAKMFSSESDVLYHIIEEEEIAEEHSLDSDKQTKDDEPATREPA
nr:hypothetical protein [Tanacetum cinerariifolium]